MFVWAWGTRGCEVARVKDRRLSRSTEASEGFWRFFGAGLDRDLMAALVLPGQERQSTSNLALLFAGDSGLARGTDTRG